eukprot:1001190-Amorphochlora_amoeboformis.AAC.3
MICAAGHTWLVNPNVTAHSQAFYNYNYNSHTSLYNRIHIVTIQLTHGPVQVQVTPCNYATHKPLQLARKTLTASM